MFSSLLIPGRRLGAKLFVHCKYVARGPKLLPALTAGLRCPIRGSPGGQRQQHVRNDPSCRTLVRQRKGELSQRHVGGHEGSRDGSRVSLLPRPGLWLQSPHGGRVLGSPSQPCSPQRPGLGKGGHAHPPGAFHKQNL